MTGFAEELEELRQVGPEGIGRFAASIDREWIVDALQATGKSSIRTRKFPAEQAVWLVLGMGLFEDRAIIEVVDHLDLVVPGVKSLAPSAVTQGRYRLGPEPIRWLFLNLSGEWADEAGIGEWRGLTTYGVDGTHLRIQDTDDNYETFGKPGGRGGPGDAGYPQVRLVCLMNLGTRILVDAEFGPWSSSEHELASEFWSSIPDDSLTILDRGFVNFLAWHRVTQHGENRHLLLRIKKNQSFVVVKHLADGSVIGRFRVRAESRRGWPDVPGHFQARVIAYSNENGKTTRLMTSLLDPDEWPAEEIVGLYHERWELEVGYDELKTHMLHRKESLRSKKPEGVYQELWGLLLTYNLIRREMLLAAKEFKLAPNRIAFVPSLHWIRTFWLTAWRTAPGALPRHLGKLRSSLRVLVLPPRRSHRRFARHVKIKMSNYSRNRGRRGILKPIDETEDSP